VATNILMPALSPTTPRVMARPPEPREARAEGKLHDRAIQGARVGERERLWIPAGVYPRAALRADPGAGMTEGGR
jgi:hypothetical protein